MNSVWLCGRTVIFYITSLWLLSHTPLRHKLYSAQIWHYITHGLSYVLIFLHKYRYILLMKIGSFLIWIDTYFRWLMVLTVYILKNCGVYNETTKSEIIIKSVSAKMCISLLLLTMLLVIYNLMVDWFMTLLSCLGGGDVCVIRHTGR